MAAAGGCRGGAGSSRICYYFDMAAVCIQPLWLSHTVLQPMQAAAVPQVGFDTLTWLQQFVVIQAGPAELHLSTAQGWGHSGTLPTISRGDRGG